MRHLLLGVLTTAVKTLQRSSPGSPSATRRCGEFRRRVIAPRKPDDAMAGHCFHKLLSASGAVTNGPPRFSATLLRRAAMQDPPDGTR